MGKLTESSGISLGLVVILCVSLGTTLVWTGAQGRQIEVNTRDISDLKAVNEKTQEQYTEILVGITSIQSELKHLKEDSQKGKK